MGKNEPSPRDVIPSETNSDYNPVSRINSKLTELDRIIIHQEPNVVRGFKSTLRYREKMRKANKIPNKISVAPVKQKIIEFNDEQDKV